jgi:hypothetical protein
MNSEVTDIDARILLDVESETEINAARLAGGFVPDTYEKLPA